MVNPLNSETAGDYTKAHRKADTDTEQQAIHHTLGKGPLQAAPGNHNHDGDYSDPAHNHDLDYSDITHNHDADYAPLLAAVPLGAAVPYFGSTDPSAGFLICDGRELLRADYPELMAVSGLSFANGPSGATHFLLPDPRGRRLVGADGSHALKGTGGANTATLTDNELPAHTHGGGSYGATSAGSAHTHTLDGRGSAGATVTRVSQGTSGTATDTNAVQTSGAHTHNVTGTSGSAGSGNSFSIEAPWYGVNFIIRVL